VIVDSAIVAAIVTAVTTILGAVLSVFATGLAARGRRRREDQIENAREQREQELARYWEQRRTAEEGQPGEEERPGKEGQPEEEAPRRPDGMGDARIYEVPPQSGESIMRTSVDTRLREAKNAIRAQTAVEKYSMWSGRSLVAGQFILGGLLASAFIQQTLSSTLVGSLGLVVLLSQIIRERYNPEGSAKIARTRIVRLENLIRKTEDDLALYDARKNGYNSDETATPSLHEILARLSEGLTESESLENGADKKG
jgi:hypothetical protein